MNIKAISNQNFGILPPVYINQAPVINDIPAIIRKSNIIKAAENNYFLTSSIWRNIPKTDTFIRQEAIVTDPRIFVVIPRGKKSPLQYQKIRVLSNKPLSDEAKLRLKPAK